MGAGVRKQGHRQGIARGGATENHRKKVPAFQPEGQAKGRQHQLENGNPEKHPRQIIAVDVHHLGHLLFAGKKQNRHHHRDQADHDARCRLPDNHGNFV